MKNHMTIAASAALFSLYTTSALASPESDVSAIRAEIQSMKQTYEGRIADLESKLKKIEATKTNETASQIAQPKASSSKRSILNNEFNPSIGVILNGRFSNYSNADSEIAGFAVGEEGERGRDGLALDESEINFSASVDDKFYGSMTAAIVREDGEDKIELEESYIQTLPGFGLPGGRYSMRLALGLSLKVGMRMAAERLRAL
jgi:hypothetical protein